MSRDLARLKRAFFSSDAVRKRIDRKTWRVLSRLGLHVMRAAKKSLKYRADDSAPAAAGSPPFARRHSKFRRKKKDRKTGEAKPQPASPLRELIFFVYEESRRTVSIGPAGFSGGVGTGVVPKALEYGGATKVRSRGGVVSGHVLARPFMRPARDAVLAKTSIADEYRK